MSAFEGKEGNYISSHHECVIGAMEMACPPIFGKKHDRQL